MVSQLVFPFWDVEFFHGHSQMSEDLYARIMHSGECSEDELKGKSAPSPPGAQCLKLIGEMQKEVGFFYAYNLYEGCPSEVPSSVASRRMLSGSAATKLRTTVAAYPTAPVPGDGDTGLGAPCLGSAMSDYMALNVTKKGLGIPLDNNWIELDNGIGFNYTTDATFVGYVYKKAIAAGKRVLVYEGDSDACGLQTAPIEDIWVPFFGKGTRDADQWTPVGTLGSTSDSTPLGLTMTQPWRPFGVVPAGRKVQGGFSIAWNDGQVTFASIRGAGHLAPLYRPAAAFTMMQAYQLGQPMPPSFYPKFE